MLLKFDSELHTKAVLDNLWEGYSESDAYSDYTWDSTYLTRVLHNKRINGFVHKNYKGIITGHLLYIEQNCILDPTKKETSVISIYIRREFRNKGFGIYLIKKLKQSVNSTIYVSDSTKIYPNLDNLFSRLGFRLTGTSWST